MKILLVRTDKLGDVVLTTPALELLHKNFPDWQIDYLGQNYTAPLFLHHPYVRQFISINSLDLKKELQQKQYDASIHFYVDWRSAQITFLSRIPQRIGPFSKLASFFLTERIRQNRSQVEKHEAEYNCDLVRFLGAKGDLPNPKLYLNSHEIDLMRKQLSIWFAQDGLRPIIIHPGSFDSAEKWPLSSFFQLAEKLAGEGQKVIVTSGRGEESVAHFFKTSYQKNIFVLPSGSLTLRELMALVSLSALLIANSTGPLHLASALNVPTLSFFPLLPKVTSPTRWRPLGSNQKVLTPQNSEWSVASIPIETALFAALSQVRCY